VLAVDDLHRRIERVREAYRDCRICPRDCGVDRLHGSAGAYCGLGERAWVYKELVHLGEEEVVSPTWLLDLGGCSLRCLFCTEWTHVTKPRAQPAGWLAPRWFAHRCGQRKRAGATSVSFAGGDPTVSLLGVLEALAAVAPEDQLPVVWNCNGWTSPLVRELLDGVVDCWVIDLKFGDPGCANRLAATGPGYLDGVRATLDAVAPVEARTADRVLPPLIIRHLLMPRHAACCTRPVLDEIATRWPLATVNLMTTYLPFGPAERPLRGSPELAQMNAVSDVDEAVVYAKSTIKRLLIDGKALQGADP